MPCFEALLKNLPYFTVKRELV